MALKKKGLTNKFLKKPQDDLFKRSIQIRVSSSVFWEFILILILVILFLVFTLVVNKWSILAAMSVLNDFTTKNNLLAIQVSLVNTEIHQLQVQLAYVEAQTWKSFLIKNDLDSLVILGVISFFIVLGLEGGYFDEGPGGAPEGDNRMPR